MKLTRLASLFLILTFLFFVLPACNSGGASSDTTASDSSASDTTATTTKEETTPAPETTVKETEPPKVYEYTTVFQLDFSTMADGATVPFNNNQVSNLRIEGGLLKGTSTGGDPFITYKGGDATFPAESVQVIEIKFMNKSQDYNMQLFFTTDAPVNWSESASYKAFVDWNASDGDKNDWNIVQLDTSESADWANNITNFRLDPFSGEGDFEISYIKFMTATLVSG